ncbi:MAG TPA: ATP-binding cassette domain-containing protein [Vicinamibacteria bacterium]|nr:ATP-binding cassette domain-containing protein [Vicinamibacteria bacterium]
MPDTGLDFDAALSFGGFELEARFSVAEGETLALVGPSGAGKSTCLGIIAGLVPPRAGRVVCGGEVWNDHDHGLILPPERRRVGMLFQEFALFPHLTLQQNVGYGARCRGRSRAEAEAVASRWLERLGLGGLGERRVAELSGGQRQRGALARALASEPRLLLLDEPFGSLDVATRGSVRSELRRFLAEFGLPTVLVTHDPVDALALGERIAVLEDGRLTQVGTREQLLSAPRSAFVAELAGLNLYRADLADGRGLKEARASGVSFHVLADDHHGPAFVAFAPAEVSLSRERLPGSAQNAFLGRVLEVRPLPDRLRVVLDVGVVLVAEVTREAAAALGLGAGRPLWASIKATAIHVYG